MVPMICLESIEMHRSDRMMYQFGMRQHILGLPISSPSLEGSSQHSDYKYINSTLRRTVIGTILLSKSELSLHNWMSTSLGTGELDMTLYTLIMLLMFTMSSDDPLSW